MIVVMECGCEIVSRRVGTREEVRCCVWHWQQLPCRVCGEPIGKNGHEDRDGEPVCDGCRFAMAAEMVCSGCGCHHYVSSTRVVVLTKRGEAGGAGDEAGPVSGSETGGRCRSSGRGEGRKGDVRLFAYKLLTQAILLLGWVRERIVLRAWHEKPPGRVFDLYSDDRWKCCDCGLVHEATYFGPDEPCGHEPAYLGAVIVGHTCPLRPKGYDYTWRKAAATPDLAIESSPSTGKAKP